MNNRSEIGATSGGDAVRSNQQESSHPLLPTHQPQQSQSHPLLPTHQPQQSQSRRQQPSSQHTQPLLPPGPTINNINNNNGTPHPTSSPSSSRGRVHQIALDLLSPWLGLASLEDWVGVLRMLSFGLLLLGRIYAGMCVNHAYVWDAQRCNPMSLAQGMPHDQLLAMYLWPVLYHSAMQGT